MVGVVAVSCGEEERKKLKLTGVKSSWLLRTGYPITRKHKQIPVGKYVHMNANTCTLT